MQATFKTAGMFQGVGLHSGAPARLEIHPAPAGHGIVFRRTDLSPAVDIPARWDRVTPSRLCTLLDDGKGTTLSTVEHVMAALAGTGIHNARILADGPEVPILDGSAAPFVRAILRAGFNVLVHCKGGLGRAGTVAARLLVELDWAPADAIAAVRAVRPECCAG